MATATRRSGRPTRASIAPPPGARSLDDIAPDRYRAFVFPNRIREQRQAQGLHKLMALSNKLADIPYIRLSKIERGEVVARADELVRIAAALGIGAADLLVDTGAPGFDLAAWADPFHDPKTWDEQDERNAVLLGAALRLRRHQDRSLTIALLDRDYGLPAVILSRLENAQKPLQRWNEATLASLCRLFGADSVGDLVDLITAQYLRGEFDSHVRTITDPEAREARTRQRIAELRAELRDTAGTAPAKTRGSAKHQLTKALPVPTLPAFEPAAALPPVQAEVRRLAVLGAPLKEGLIAPVSTGTLVEAPSTAGPRSFALRVCRATLGAGLPPGAVVIVDPDRPPVLGSLAAIRSDDAYRLVTVTLDRNGATMGYSVAPDIAVNIDELDPGEAAAIIAAVFA